MRDTKPDLNEILWYELRSVLLSANFHRGLRWPVETKVYPIEDEE